MLKVKDCVAIMDKMGFFYVESFRNNKTIYLQFKKKVESETIRYGNYILSEGLFSLTVLRAVCSNKL